MEPGDRVEGIEFAIAPVAPRRRRVDLAAIGAVVVALGVVVAALKPWAEPSSALTDAASAPPAPTAAVVVSAEAPTSPDRMFAVIDAHDAWGVRAIVRGSSSVDGPAASPYAERWTAAEERAGGDRLAVLDTGERSVLALGVTVPGFVSPRDVQVWRPADDGSWEVLDVAHVAQSAPGGAMLLEPPTDPVTGSDIWPAGAYRIELRIGTRTSTIDLRLPGRFERIPEPPTAG